MRDKSNGVKTARQILFLGGIFLGGCSTAHDVAVTSFRVIDAPANFVRRRIDDRDTATTTTTTTTTVASDVNTPGQHVAPSKRDSQRRQVTTTQPGPSATPRVTRNTTTEKPRSSPSAAPRSAANPPAQTQYPTAKIVPGKPGYVFSPYDPSGGYVDVNGYTSGSKVKDPYSGKIFLVP
ncbi:MAG: hypothetical protein QOC70_729 [Verrucomicrobiota bacterium]|jgi:hypothetical protein